MSDILKKLGLKCPVDEIKSYDDYIKLYTFLELPLFKDIYSYHNAVIALTQRKQWEEMLEMLIRVAMSMEANNLENSFNAFTKVWIQHLIPIIETHTNKSWTEIKELIVPKQKASVQIKVSPQYHERFENVSLENKGTIFQENQTHIWIEDSRGIINRYPKYMVVIKRLLEE